MNPFDVLHELQTRLAPLYGVQRSLEDRRYDELQSKRGRGKVLTADEQRYLERYEQAVWIAASDPVPPTQSLLDYSELKVIKEDLDDALSATAHFTPVKNLVLGTVGSLELNASIANVAGSFLIVMNAGLMAAIERLSLLIAYVANFGDPYFVKGLDRDRIEVAKPAFVDTIEKFFLYLEAGNDIGEQHTFRLRFAPDDPHRFWFAAMANYSAKRFILGHEYSHIVLRHLTPNATGRIRLVNEEHVARMGAWRYWRSDLASLEDEFDADTFSYFLCIVSGERGGRFTRGDFLSSVIVGWVGFVLAFEVLDIYDLIFDRWQRDFMPREGHPPPTDREGLLMTFTHERVPHEFLQHLMDVRFGLRNTIVSLWQACSNDLEKTMESNSGKIRSQWQELYGGESDF